MHPVGQKDPNPFGLYDMHGNVSQWCQDWYGDYEKSETENPQGPVQGASRVSRGGSWNDGPLFCPAVNRSWNNPGYRDGFIGFRVVMVPVSRTP